MMEGHFSDFRISVIVWTLGYVANKLYYPWLITSVKPGSEWSQTTIIAIDLVGRYCVSRGNNANTCPNLKTDTPLAGILI